MGTLPQATGLLKLLQHGSFLQAAVQRAGPVHGAQSFRKACSSRGTPRATVPTRKPATVWALQGLQFPFQATCCGIGSSTGVQQRYLLWHSSPKGYRSFPLHCGPLHRLMQGHLCSSTWSTSSLSLALVSQECFWHSPPSPFLSYKCSAGFFGLFSQIGTEKPKNKMNQKNVLKLNRNMTRFKE